MKQRQHTQCNPTREVHESQHILPHLQVAVYTPKERQNYTVKVYLLN